MTTVSPPLEYQPLEDLTRACRGETIKFRKGQTSDGRFCLEIFRRALRIDASHSDGNAPIYLDDAARETIIAIYTDFIQAQINRQAVPWIERDDVVQQIWLRFWQAARSGLSFPTLQAALSYLHLATVTTVIEVRRRERQRQREESLEQPEGRSERVLFAAQDMFSEYTRRRFVTRCQEILAEPLERQVFWMRYSMGYAPREIARELAQQGISIKARAPTARIVSDLLEQMIKRLAVDLEIRDLLQSD